MRKLNYLKYYDIREFLILIKSISQNVSNNSRTGINDEVFMYIYIYTFVTNISSYLEAN